MFGAAIALGNDYMFFAGYVVLQYVVLSTAWNILGGYCGYVNFGTAAFFALGAYSTVAIYKFVSDNDSADIPLPLLMLLGGVVSGHRRLRHGLSDACGCAARSLPSRRWRSPSCCRRWSSTGIMSAARAAPISSGPRTIAPIGNYVRYLFLIMLVLAVGRARRSRG